jgi:hypothetical protein
MDGAFKIRIGTKISTALTQHSVGWFNPKRCLIGLAPIGPSYFADRQASCRQEGDANDRQESQIG